MARVDHRLNHNFLPAKVLHLVFENAHYLTNYTLRPFACQCSGHVAGARSDQTAPQSAPQRRRQTDILAALTIKKPTLKTN